MSKKDLAIEDQDETRGEPVEAADGQEEAELSEEEKALEELKDSIELEREDVGALTTVLTITVPRDFLDDKMGEQFAELQRDATVPGFRKGRAPIKLVEKRFAMDVGDQLIGQLVGRGYLAAIKKEELDPLGDPRICVTVREERTVTGGGTRRIETEKLLPLGRALEHMQLPKEGPLTFKAEVELKPQFDLPKLDKIPVQTPRLSVDDDDVEAEIMRLRRVRAVAEPVDGTIEPDDVLYGDLTICSGEHVLVQESNYELAARDQTIHDIVLAGWGDALTGKRSGDDVALETTIPDDYEDLNLRGAPVTCTFTVREVKRWTPAAMDDTFLAGLGFDNEQDLRATTRSELTSRLDDSLRWAIHVQIGEYLVNNTSIGIPEGLSRRQTERSVERRMMQLYREGIPEAEIAKAADEMRAKAHEQVARDLKLFFILEKIAADRGVDVTEEQLNSAIAAVAARTNKRFDRMRDELSRSDGLVTLYVQLREYEVFEQLAADAEITEVDGPKKKAPAKTKKKVTTPKKPAAATTKKKTPGRTAAAKKTAKKKTTKGG